LKIQITDQYFSLKREYEVNYGAGVAISFTGVLEGPIKYGTMIQQLITVNLSCGFLDKQMRVQVITSRMDAEI